MRVDGEKLAAGPIERILQRLDPVSRAAVYAVPDDRVGDAVMAAIVLRDNASLVPGEFTVFFGEQLDVSPNAWPCFVRSAADLPTTATNKILERTLVEQGLRQARAPSGDANHARPLTNRRTGGACRCHQMTNSRHS